MKTKKTITFLKILGVSGTTECFVKKINSNEYEARMGIALLGSTNMNEEQFKECNYDPFHPNFRDNYVVGISNTEEQAIEKMKEDLDKTSEMLWKI